MIPQCEMKKLKKRKEAQIGREHGLQCSADSPEIRHFEPALIFRQHRHDHDNHSPIAKLKGQHLLPAHDAAAITHKDQIPRVIQNEQNGQCDDDAMLSALRFATAHNCCKKERQRDC